jgi:membrane protease YdiL (CAAX protease family)
MNTKNASQMNLMKRFPIAAFFILAFALGTGTIFLVIQGLLPSNLVLVSVLSALIAGIIMTGVEDGKAGLKLMLSRVLIWRVGIGYWLFVFLFIVPVIVLGSMFNPLFSGDPISFSNIEPDFSIVLLFISFFIVAGLGQELGWTGFLMLRLQTRYSALVSCIIRAVLVAVWHLPVFIYSWLQPTAFVDLPYDGWIAQRGFLVAIVTATLLFILPWSIFYTWIFNNTRGSLLLVAVLHGSEIWVAYWMLSTGINSNNLNNYWGYGALMLLIAAIIVLVTGSQNLSRKRTRILHQPMGG